MNTLLQRQKCQAGKNEDLMWVVLREVTAEDLVVVVVATEVVESKVDGIKGVRHGIKIKNPIGGEEEEGSFKILMAQK